MKTVIQFLFAAVSIITLSAQDTTTARFNVRLYGAYQVPPNDSANAGVGIFTLEGDVLTYVVTIGQAFAPTGAGIYGPAAPGENGELLFDWPLYFYNPPVPVPNPLPGTVFGYYYKGSVSVTPDQVEQLEAGLWYVSIKSARYPDGELRGQLCPQTPDTDCDFDGVPNSLDRCPNTKPGAGVDSDGCSIDQLVPCHAQWDNHRDYVRAVKEQTFRFWREGRITAKQRADIIKQAERSDCGSQPAFPGPGPLVIQPE